MNMNRRNFLRGSGAFVALPLLESAGFKAFAAGSNKKTLPPKRLAFMGMGYGVTAETWFPDIKDSGAAYKLSEGLSPLKRHKKDFTIVQGCKHKFSRQPHWGSTFWLTGANQYGTPGQSFSNTISADQVMANAVGKHTRFTSIQLDSRDTKSGGHGPGTSLAWDQRGKPIPAFNSALMTYHKLFSADNMPLAQRQSMIADRRSVLDSIHIEAKRIQKGLTKTDVDKLNEYYQSIRDIETSLSKEEAWLDVPKAKAPFAAPADSVKGIQEIELMYKLMVAALQTDSTRVITYRLPVHSLMQSLQIGANPHNMSHYKPGETMEGSKKRDKAHSELLAGFIDQLKATKEADGSRLFDNVALAFGSNIRSIHYMDNCPTLISGGAANIKLGHNLVLPKDTPLNNVWLTMLQGVGLNLKNHGDSTGIIKELQA
ncbi:hypothetical protein LNTAR_06984 [Lentisphaera araneosa HTCC2155]|uniref:DUF1552 domain-containing protein n=1 Tax=Lentisphaera araneosa HTCC2155 TaxID=313628 RepID=A6DMT2_9BACT|nr:DUF1552 domain-containing protein [Lentisphaera araneosa]EDM26968.1 hypothetical protein LNTAR_06984 [Lentisphaera araneosa HTCC2155]